MYDSHIYCKEYKDLKYYIVDILNGDIKNYDIDDLSSHIQDLYDNGKMSGNQYDDLIRYVQDL